MPPQLVGARAGDATAQLLVSGGLFAVLAAVPDSTWGLAAGAARARFATSPARLRRLGGTGGPMVIGPGVGPATGRRD